MVSVSQAVKNSQGVSLSLEITKSLPAMFLSCLTHGQGHLLSCPGQLNTKKGQKSLQTSQFSRRVGE